MCGEYYVQRTAAGGVLGSPPHVWGILNSLAYLGFHDRITPTCVGNTKIPDRNPEDYRDHPHMCGEY